MNRTVLYVGGAAVVAFILWKRGMLSGIPGVPPVTGGTNGGTNGGVIPGPIASLPGGPVINCITYPCPGDTTTDPGGRVEPGDAPWWSL